MEDLKSWSQRTTSSRQEVPNQQEILDHQGTPKQPDADHVIRARVSFSTYHSRVSNDSGVTINPAGSLKEIPDSDRNPNRKVQRVNALRLLLVDAMIKMYKHAFGRYRLQQELLRSQHRTPQSFKTGCRQRPKEAPKAASTATKQQSWKQKEGHKGTSQTKARSNEKRRGKRVDHILNSM